MSPGRTRTCVLLALLALSAPAGAQDVLHGFVDEPVVTGLTVPVAFTTLPDGRILVAEKAGVVRTHAGDRRRRAVGSATEPSEPRGILRHTAARHGRRVIRAYTLAVIASRPPMNGRSAAGITTEPSFC